MSSKKTFSSPLSHSPKTIGECLDCRKNTERRINNCLNNSNNDSTLVFLKEGQVKLDSAESQVQSVLDRYQTVCELNELVSAVAVLKKTDVVMPAFCDGMEQVRFSLGQLRDSKEWFLPLLSSLVSHLTEQARDIKQQMVAHDRKIEIALQTELDKNKRDHEDRKQKAKQFGEEVPLDNELEALQETAKNRSKTLMSVSVDPVGLRGLVDQLRSFVTMLETYAEVKIDAANSTDISAEVKQFKERREEAFAAITNGTVATVHEEPEGFQYLSLAELNIAMNELRDTISLAIGKLCLVSFKRGQNKDVEHPNVVYAKERLFDVLFNLTTLIKCRQTFREGMNLNFPTLHPLSGVPLSVDGLVRLGYTKDSAQAKQSVPNQTQKRGRNVGGRGRGARATPQPTPSAYDYDHTPTASGGTTEYYSLAECLGKLFKMMDSVGPKMEAAKKEYERELQASISAKQEARTKNATALKPGELDDIAKSVRASETKTWSVADGLDKAISRVTNLIQQIEEMQSSVRKSANSNIKVLVPNSKNMHWVQDLDALNGW
jgi:hypothetical protein